LDNAILKETGARILWWQAYGHNVYLSNGKPVRTPSDLKGKKVRTYGKVLSWTVEEAGGVPTIMSGSKQFLAYQQHAVDIGLTGLSGVESRKLYEVMKNVTLSYDSIIEFVAIINDNFFKSLSAKNQAIILKASATVEQHLRDKVYSGEEAMAKRLESKMNVIRLSNDERKQWQRIAKPVLERYRAKVGPLADKVIKAAHDDEAGM
jgi:C4-dicarboxylate-binding protein DctP